VFDHIQPVGRWFNATGNCLSGYYSVYNLTTGADAGDCYTCPPGTGDGFDAAPGDGVTFVATASTNSPKTGEHTLQHPRPPIRW
jgi:hypothetical protein